MLPSAFRQQVLAKTRLSGPNLRSVTEGQQPECILVEKDQNGLFSGCKLACTTRKTSKNGYSLCVSWFEKKELSVPLSFRKGMSQDRMDVGRALRASGLQYREVENKHSFLPSNVDTCFH